MDLLRSRWYRSRKKCLTDCSDERRINCAIDAEKRERSNNNNNNSQQPTANTTMMSSKQSPKATTFVTISRNRILRSHQNQRLTFVQASFVTTRWNEMNDFFLTSFSFFFFYCFVIDYPSNHRKGRKEPKKRKG